MDLIAIRLVGQVLYLHLKGAHMVYCALNDALLQEYAFSILSLSIINNNKESNTSLSRGLDGSCLTAMSPRNMNFVPPEGDNRRL